jgi:hypothetical protein
MPPARARTFAGTLLRAAAPLTLALLFAAPADAQDRQASLVLRVTTQEGAEPVAGARVTVEGTALAAVTDAEGTARIGNVPAGARTVRVERIGYRASRFEADFRRGEALQASIDMETQAVELGGVTVTAKQEQPLLRRNGFYERQAGTPGLFIDREAIASPDPGRTTDLVNGIRSTRVSTSGRRGIAIRQRRMERMCEVQVWLNGVPVPPEAIQHLSPDRVEGIELYRGDEIPLNFHTGRFDQPPCGALVVWTRGAD